MRAHAEFLGRASASGQFESNSNVFDLQRGYEPSGTSGSSPPSDTYYAYGAELDGDYEFGRQNVYLRLNTKNFNYQRFQSLDHTDYDIVAQAIWKLGSKLDGIVGVTRNRSMVPFLDLAGTDLTLAVVTQQRERASVNYKVNSAWVLGTQVNRTQTKQPVTGGPDLQLTETTGSETLTYLGNGRFSSGIMASYTSGEYDGSIENNLNPSYSQSQGALTGTFNSRRTIFDGSLGYTRRTSSAGSDSTSGLSGLFDFTYQLTPKTAWRVSISRDVRSYLLNSGSEFDTDAGAGVSWRASYKLTLTVDYMYGYRQFPAQQGDSSPGSTRIDHQQQANLAIDYEPKRWIIIRPYANIQTRSSSLVGRNSNSTVFGISVTLMTSDQSNANSVPMESHWH